MMDSSDTQIYRKHRDDLIRYATSLVGPDRAEDVLSTVVLRTLRRRSLADLDEARPYLFRAVLNESRRVTRWSRHLELSDPTTVVDTSDLDVLDAVLHLPVRQRAAVYLVYWADMSIADAARYMGIGDGTLKRYLHLARRSLKGVLA